MRFTLDGSRYAYVDRRRRLSDDPIVTVVDRRLDIRWPVGPGQDPRWRGTSQVWWRPQDDTRVQMARLSLAKGNFDAAYSELAPLVDRFLEKGEGEKAASLLQQLVQKNASHTKTLTKLVDVYRQLKNDRAVATTYSQLTEAYAAQGVSVTTEGNQIVVRSAAPPSQAAISEGNAATQ